MARPHLIYLAWGFPPAAKSCTFRMLATANSFVRAGWDVTVITLEEEVWRHEQGIDLSLLDLVDPRIVIRRVPLRREDLETDVRRYSQERAMRPRDWLKAHRAGDTVDFPEVVYGRWHDPVIEYVRQADAERPADLFLTSASPYTFFAPALDLSRRRGTPFVVDYRDAWAIDILKDRKAFEPDSREGRIEAELLSRATEAWFVNGQIRDAYAELYPLLADRFHVVRNGSDVAAGVEPPPVRLPDPEQGLAFGYLGTMTFDVARITALCDAWRLARSRSPLLARSRLEFRGHLGTGAARGATAQADVIERNADIGISYGGPVGKAETGSVYAGWDVLVLCLVGGRFVTSGKVYDYMSTGLPIMSVHQWEHAAAEVLSDYPLWVRNESLEVEDIADAFVEAAERAVSASVPDHERARTVAQRYERYAQLAPAVERLSAEFGARPAADEPDLPVHVPAPAPATPPDRAHGQHVLLFHTTPLTPRVTAGIAEIRAAGGAVTLVGPESTERDPGLVDAVIELRRPTQPILREETREAPGKLERARIVATNMYRKRVLSRVVRALGLPAMWWMAAERSPEVAEAIEAASVIGSLDEGAVYLAWNACRANPYAPTRHGIGPILESVGLRG